MISLKEYQSAFVLIWVLLSSAYALGKSSGEVSTLVLPDKNELPISLESFCSGIPNVTAITKQNISQELGVFCNGANQPTDTLRQLAANPYEGDGNANDFIIDLPLSLIHI